MKLYLLNTFQGLKPLYDDDYEEKKKLKIGEVYKAEIKLERNLAFHRKYFALINCAWEHQSEKTTAFFAQNKDVFRKTVEVAAGHFEQVYSIDRREWVQVPKSIAFDKMDNGQFEILYNNVKDVLFQTFLRDVNENTFMKKLINF